MKKIIYFALIFLSFQFQSCVDKKKEILEKKSQPEQAISLSKYILSKKINTNATLLNWNKHYVDFVDKDFNLKNFNFKSDDSLTRIKGSVYGSFDKDFDAIYLSFLIYSPNKKQYLDIDSYGWQVDDKSTKEVTFSPDQEISLVDLESKKIERIAFNGPSQWVEDAFWINETTLVFLQNNTEFTPFISIIDLSKNKIITFTYNKKLKETSGYSDERMRLKGFDISGE